MLGRSCIDLETLQTVISEIEIRLYDRPLTYLASDSTDQDTLTLSHLLEGLHFYLPQWLIVKLENIVNRFIKQIWINISKIIEIFGKRWKYEYFSTLWEYYRTSGYSNQTIQVGNAVQIHELHGNKLPLVNSYMERIN